jgi:hypothetical protein
MDKTSSEKLKTKARKEIQQDIQEMNTIEANLKQKEKPLKQVNQHIHILENMPTNPKKLHH